METVERELAAGYQRIKLKCKPGWDDVVFEAVRERWPEIHLSCDANSAYRMRDFDHIAAWDRFRLLMIEQPAVVRRLLLSLDAAEANQYGDLSG